MFSIGIVCIPFLQGGRGELIIQPNFQKGGLTGPQLLDGVCWERGGYFFQRGGGKCHIKYELKFKIFNDKENL